MARIPMALDASKETVGKLRWSTRIEADEADFALYIPKWRVPRPWPGRIYVTIAPSHDDTLSRMQSSSHPEAPIIAIVTPDRAHTKTYRYRPVGDEQEWQIGQPYVPFSLIPRSSVNLIIEVEWDQSSRGEFLDVPTYRED